MTDMTAFELNLAASLQRHLGDRRPVDARSIAAAAMSTTSVQAIPLGRRWPRFLGAERSDPRMRSLAWVAVATALLLAALALAFLAGQQPPQPVPPPPTGPLATQQVTDALPTPSAAVLTPTIAAPSASLSQAIPPLLPVAGPYVPVITRQSDPSTVDVLVVGADREERLVDQISVEHRSLDQYYPPRVSTDGWLWISSSITANSGYQDSFVNLSQPATGAWNRDARPQAAGSYWGPNGLLATDNGNLFIDPRTHATWEPAANVYLGGGPILIWSGDGVGVYDEDGPGVGIQPLDGSAFEPGLRQSWAPYGVRVVGKDGSVLCGWWADLLGLNKQNCQGLRVGTVSGAGSLEWASTLPDGAIVKSSSFAEDGVSMWAIVVGESASRPLEIVRLVGPGEMTVVASLARSTVPVSFSPEASLDIAGLAPDDSLIAIKNIDDAGTYLLVAADGAAVNISGVELAGFVPASMADTWPTVEAP